MGMWNRRRSSRVQPLAAGALLVTALACGDAPTGPTTADFNREREESAKRVTVAKEAAAKRAAGPAAAAQAEPTKADPATGVALIDRDYSYDATGKRDPFRSFTWERPDRMRPLAEAGPLEQFDLNQLELVAVVWRTGNARALLQDPSGTSYIVGQGAAIGKNQGHVISIDDNVVVVKETYVDYLGQETTKDIEMRMRRSEGG
jgi:type IV pilus assembly PilP-like protein